MGFQLRIDVLVSAILYLVVRFGVAEALKNYTCIAACFTLYSAALTRPN